MVLLAIALVAHQPDQPEVEHGELRTRRAGVVEVAGDEGEAGLEQDLPRCEEGELVPRGSLIGERDLEGHRRALRERVEPPDEGSRAAHRLAVEGGDDAARAQPREGRGPFGMERHEAGTAASVPPARQRSRGVEDRHGFGRGARALQGACLGSNLEDAVPPLHLEGELPGAEGVEPRAQPGGVEDLLPLDREDHVAALDPGRLGGRARGDLDDADPRREEQIVQGAAVVLADLQPEEDLGSGGLAGPGQHLRQGVGHRALGAELAGGEEASGQEWGERAEAGGAHASEGTAPEDPA